MQTNKIHSHQQDSGDKLQISFNASELPLVESEIKRITGWRNSKKYKSIYERFCSTGSSEYNLIIAHLYPRFGVKA